VGGARVPALRGDGGIVRGASSAVAASPPRRDLLRAVCREHQQPDLRAEIERLRTAGQQPPPGVPAAQRTSEDSLRQRLATLSEENRRLREENHALKTELALAYGERRHAGSS
jgi:hypothetical protein